MLRFVCNFPPPKILKLRHGYLKIEFSNDDSWKLRGTIGKIEWIMMRQYRALFIFFFYLFILNSKVLLSMHKCTIFNAINSWGFIQRTVQTQTIIVWEVTSLPYLELELSLYSVRFSPFEVCRVYPNCLSLYWEVKNWFVPNLFA